jgi:hypothetical protein
MHCAVPGVGNAAFMQGVRLSSQTEKPHLYSLTIAFSEAASTTKEVAIKMLEAKYCGLLPTWPIMGADTV